ncbi:MAG: hypothetical protein KF744_14810 [Taibaiella sp.]|nr:hypothetical protein [Taibaiella sp.]
MSQDYSLLTAKTGIAQISTANGNLNGVGSTLLFTASANGSIVKSITIKAIQPVKTGMVRLFIGDGVSYALYKEVGTPIVPEMESTPTPTPIFVMDEVTVVGNFILQAGQSLYASTQTAQAFNIIVEALEWEYPQVLPTTCCNFKQITGNVGYNTANTANPNLNGSGSIVQVFKASNTANGSNIKSLSISALQSTNPGMIRIFVGANINSYFLMREVYIPESNQGGFQASFKEIIEMNFDLQSNYIIGVSTQNSESFSIVVEGSDWTYPI